MSWTTRNTWKTTRLDRLWASFRIELRSWSRRMTGRRRWPMIGTKPMKLRRRQRRREELLELLLHRTMTYRVKSLTIHMHPRHQMLVMPPA